jgi:hypothetical protein
MIFKIVNRFLKLNSSSLHACLISDCRNQAMVSRRNPARSVTEILPTLEFGDIRPPSPDFGRLKSSRNLVEFRLWLEAGRIWTDPAINPVGSDRIWRSPAKPARRNSATATSPFPVAVARL